MKSLIITSIFIVLSFICWGQRDITHSLRFGVNKNYRVEKFGFGLREEFRISVGPINTQHILSFTPEFQYHLSNKFRIQMAYSFFLNENLNRFNLDFVNDFGFLDTRIRVQTGWDEFQSRGDMVRLFWRFKKDRPIKGLFNPSTDFELFYDVNTTSVLDRYRGGVSNSFKIDDKFTGNISIQTQLENKLWVSRTLLYRLRLVYRL